MTIRTDTIHTDMIRTVATAMMMPTAGMGDMITAMVARLSHWSSIGAASLLWLWP